MSSPRLAATADLAARRRRLLALHARHAGAVRAVFYWLGADLHVIDGAVLRTFLRLLPHADEVADAEARALLGRLAYRVACVPAPEDAAASPTPAPRLPLAADLLARLLATHATAIDRAAFVLAELTGLGPHALATELRVDAETLRVQLAALRRTLAGDPEVIALGGPRALLTASFAPFIDDPAWSRRHAAELAARLLPARASAGLGDRLQSPPAIVGLSLGLVALMLLLRPGPPPPALARVAPVAVPVPAPPPLAAPPPPLPVPADMSPAPAPVRKAVKPRRRPAAAGEGLAAREKLAQARDPGAVIVELEMLGAGRKALTSDPRQSLAYADQHARDYPDSQLAAQRAELRVRALCALGRRDEARAEAQRRPSPKVQDALRDACKP